jgi:hypothetical protein
MFSVRKRSVSEQDVGHEGILTGRDSFISF